MKLTEKQKRFCQEYLIDLNATQAAIRSGYSKKTARKIGQENLTKPVIQKKIKEAIEERKERTEITQDKVIYELALIAFSDLADYIDIDENTGVIIAKTFKKMEKGKSRALESIKEDRAIKEDADGKQVTVYDKVTFKLHSKIKALELLGKHLGMFVDKFDVGDELKKILIKRIITTERPD